MTEQQTATKDVSVTQALEIAAAAGVSMTRPTAIGLFKRSGAGKQIGKRYYMPRELFVTILDRGEVNATQKQS